jgi:ATP-dependent exoDNAse (exonuclease V) beta subunit
MSDKALKIYNASAGSGKTYTLVQEYLRIILRSDDPMKFRRVLAMTFTNKAANEMKERVLQKLIQLSKPNHEKSAIDLKELKDTSKAIALPEKKLEERAARSLNAILHNYGMFSVMTIDKFTHKVIRTFARDLDLSMDFEVELDLNTLQKNVADLLFDQIGRDKEIDRLMTNYVESNLEDDKGWNFRESLIKFSSQLFKEDALKAIKALKDFEAKDFLEAKKKMITFNVKIENQLKSWGGEALDLIHSNGIEMQEFASGASSGIGGFFRKIASGELKTPTDTHTKTIEEDKWTSAKAFNISAIESIKDLLTKYFHQINTFIEENQEQYYLNAEILKIINNLSLMNHLLSITEELKEQDNVLLISDFYKKIAEIIAEEPVPFIYERLGVRYDHFLLDEFQDTSRLQWVNLVPLLHDSLSSKKTNLIVGDGKQAIYRWRNGEVEQFVKLPQEMDNPDNIPSLKEAEAKFRDEGEEITLEDNYRSSPDIVSFNNDFFHYLISQQDPYIQNIYKEYRQHPKKDFPGYLEFNMLSEKDQEIQLNYVLNIVNRSREKGYDLSDVCVLVRGNREGSKIAIKLTEENIPVISQDSLHVIKDRTVKFLYNLIAALANPHHLNYTKKTLEHFEKVIDETGNEALILKILNEEEVYLQQWLDENRFDIKPIEQFHSFYEFAEHLVSVFDLDISNNIYLQFFLEQIHQYEKLHSTDVHGFAEWFEDKGGYESIKSPEGADAVNIMTIHKAKGLQFPIVICAFFDWDITKNDTTKWVSDDDSILPAYFLKPTNAAKETKHKALIEKENLQLTLDHLNLVYVAFTRPETALFVVGNANTRGKNPSKVWLSPFLDKLEAEGKCDKDLFHSIGDFPAKIAADSASSNAYEVDFFKQVKDKPTLSIKNGENWDVHEIDKKRQYGTQLHLLLSEIKAEEEAEIVIKRLISKGRIDESFKVEMLSDVKRLFQNERFNSYFSASEVKNECVLIDEIGHKHIPDKIIYHHDHILVVDFKTGKEDEKKHQKQVQEYLKLLSSIESKPTRGELFYTEETQVVAVEI